MKIKDYIYNEADSSCALCGQKSFQNLTIHHLDNDRTNNEYDNQILLCRNCHCRFHERKGVTERQVHDSKKQLIIKTLSVYGVNAIKIAYRNNFGVIAMPFLLYHLVDLGLMTKEEDQMGYGNQKDATSRFAITSKGIEFYDKWF